VNHAPAESREKAWQTGGGAASGFVWGGGGLSWKALLAHRLIKRRKSAWHACARVLSAGEREVPKVPMLTLREREMIEIHCEF